MPVANLLAFTSILFVSSVHGSSCDTLSNPSNRIWTTSFDTSSIQSQVISALKLINYQPLDQCLGSIDYYNDLSQVALFALPPFAPISQYIQSKDIAEFKSELAEFLQDPFQQLKPFNAFIQTAPTAKYNNLCTFMDQIVPVLTSESVPVLMQLLNSNDCCAPLLTGIQTHTGVGFETLIKTLVTLIRNVLCAKRSPGIVEEKEFCSQTFVQAMVHPKNWGMTLNNLIRLLQTPNSRGCEAFRGEKFINTLGKPDQFKQSPWDSCSKHWDQLISFFASFPVFEKFKDLFQDGKCIPGEEIKSFLPPKMQILVMKKCFHLPNGFSVDCRFKTELEDQL